jgi:hypothetical protein
VNIFIEEHKELVECLLACDVSFILVGGYAVNYHGYNRTTGDLDVWVKPDDGNKAKLIKALEKYGIESSSLQIVAEFDFTQTIVFSIGERPFKIDFLTKVQGVTYDAADREKIVAPLDDMNIPFINLNHLVLTKIATGRPQDKADIQRLQDVEKAKNKKKQNDQPF